MFLVVVLTVVLLAMIWLWPRPPTDWSSALQTLVRQSARWAVAAQQDRSPLIAVLHANYGAGYLWALRDIATDEQIRQATGVDPLKLREAITSIQDQVTRRYARLCPEFATVPGLTDTWLAQLAGEG